MIVKEITPNPKLLTPNSKRLKNLPAAHFSNQDLGVKMSGVAKNIGVDTPNSKRWKNFSPKRLKL